MTIKNRTDASVSPARSAALSGLYGLAWRLARPLLRRHKRLRDGFSWRLAPEGWSAPPAERGQAGAAQVDVWVQAASGGEAYLAWELLRHLAGGGPLRVLVTTWTRQGLEVLHGMAENLRREHPELSIRVTLFPFDEPRLMRKALDMARPRTIVLLETELWPGLLLAAARRNIPVLILNGRMTEKSLRHYRFLERLCPGFWQSVAPDAALAISDADAARFAALFGGQRTTVVPNIKFDRCLQARPGAVPPEQAPNSGSAQSSISGAPGVSGALASLLPRGARGPWLLLASVREEEEEKLMETIRLLRRPRSGPAPSIIVAPRHMHRVSAWKERLATLQEGGPLIRSRLGGEGNGAKEQDPALILWDAFGELTALYELADAVFVGGSLAPLGGQNFLEALALGKVPCCGPHLENFAWALAPEKEDDLQTLGLLQICRSPEALASALLGQAEAAVPPEDVRKRFHAWLAPRLGGAARCAEAVKARLPR